MYLDTYRYVKNSDIFFVDRGSTSVYLLDSESASGLVQAWSDKYYY
jgi:hypothetical protein